MLETSYFRWQCQRDDCVSVSKQKIQKENWPIVSESDSYDYFIYMAELKVDCYAVVLQFMKRVWVQSFRPTFGRCLRDRVKVRVSVDQCNCLIRRSNFKTKAENMKKVVKQIKVVQLWASDNCCRLPKSLCKVTSKPIGGECRCIRAQHTLLHPLYIPINNTLFLLGVQLNKKCLMKVAIRQQ